MLLPVIILYILGRLCIWSPSVDNHLFSLWINTIAVVRLRTNEGVRMEEKQGWLDGPQWKHILGYLPPTSYSVVPRLEGLLQFPSPQCLHPQCVSSRLFHLLKISGPMTMLFLFCFAVIYFLCFISFYFFHYFISFCGVKKVDMCLDHYPFFLLENLQFYIFL